MILLKINSKSLKPVFKQVYEQLMLLIEENVLKPGDKLPSSRKLADQLGINRTTVYKAYEELWSKGFTESRPGSYSIVRKRTDVKTSVTPGEKSLIDWKKKFTPSSKKLCANTIPLKNINGTIDMASLNPDPRLMPYERFRKCLNQVLINNNKESLLTYSDTFGYKPLRSYLVEHMRTHSVNINEDEIILTNGSQNGLELILKLLVKPGDKILTERPTYASAIPLFKQYSEKIINLPLTENGMDLKLLERTIAKEKPAILYLMPNFHNPTGITSPQIYREKLLKICEHYKLPVVEDGFSEEMKYHGKNILPIKSMDKQNLVFYLGTFSKIIFPGLRIGWIAADNECIKNIYCFKKAGELSGVALTQAAMYQFCKSGFYELHLKKMHTIYKSRMHTALNALKEFIPSEKFSYTKPFGGYTLLVKSKNPEVKEEELISRIRQEGVSVVDGSRFYPCKSEPACFRISIAVVNEKEIVEGIEKIGRALKNV